MTKHYRFEQFFAIRRLLSCAIAPDGEQVLFATDISGQFNLWRVSSRGGWPDQLTQFEKESVRAIAWSPDGSRIAFAADPDGNEQTQLYLMDAVGGWPEAITAQADVEHAMTEGAFSPDGRYLAYSANARERTQVDIYLRDLTTGEVRMVCEGGLFDFGGFSPDGSQILALEVNGNTDQDIWLVDLATGQRRNLTAHPDTKAKFTPVGWRRDGTGFYFIGNQDREFDALGYYDLAAGSWSYLITPDWDVEKASLSGDGKRLAYVVNEAGCSTLHVRDLVTGQELPLPALPSGVIGLLEFAQKDPNDRLCLVMGNYRQVGTIYTLDLDRQELIQVTHSMLGNIPNEVFVEPELVYIPAFDGLQVPAWLYRPHGDSLEASVPAVLSIHGGPEAQERPTYGYGGLYQYLLSQGVAILAPNIRGSTGFGIDYQNRIHRDWGGAELRDIEACAQYLQGLHWVDRQRIAVFGGSFGGFATLSAATRLPDYWACACDFCGPANLITFVQSVPPHWRSLTKAWVGDAEEDREMLIARSPITHVDNLRCPLMVVQGATDPRVVKAESDQMVERLRAMGREVEYLVFEDEGHGFAKRANQLKGYKAMADFMLSHLSVPQRDK